MALEPTPTLAATHDQLTEAVAQVIEAAVDHDEAEAERNPEDGTWTRSQTYAVLLHKLLNYEQASRAYAEALAKAVMRG